MQADKPDKITLSRGFVSIPEQARSLSSDSFSLFAPGEIRNAHQHVKTRVKYYAPNICIEIALKRQILHTPFGEAQRSH
jgi:hypothetical protein